MSHRDTSGCEPHELQTQVEFSSHQPHEGSPETEFRQTPDREFLRDFFNDRLEFPDGLEVEIWGFEDETSGRGLPSPPIRAREGEIVHVTLKASKNAHTIHLHGIEADPRNDGVGHTSFEVTGGYTYQIEAADGVAGDPNEGMAGTYFYHCHVNTTLHVQMGMLGPMIFDPAGGRGRAFVDDPFGYDVRAETMLVPYAVDPRWHELNHAAGLNGEDVGLNLWEPTNFYLLGANLNEPWPDTPVKTVDRILATVAPDRPGLLRVLNSGYFPVFLRFNGGLQAEVFSHDGRALRNTSVRPSPPVAASTALLGFGAAERYDMRLRPPAGARPGDEFSVTVEWRHWITNRVVGTVTVPVVVIDPDTGAGSDPDTGAGSDDPPAPSSSPEPRPGSKPPTPSPGPSPRARPKLRRRRRRRRRRKLGVRRKPARKQRIRRKPAGKARRKRRR